MPERCGLVYGTIKAAGSTLVLWRRLTLTFRVNRSPVPRVESSAYTAAQEADATRMARELAERVARYYREQGWIKS